MNPILYTLSTASFLGHARRKAFKFRISFMSSLAGDTKTSVCIDGKFDTSDVWNFVDISQLPQELFNESY